MSDLISRQAAIFEITWNGRNDCMISKQDAVKCLKKLPSVEPEKCSYCIGKEVATDRFDLVQSNDIMAFIPRCKGCKYFEYDSVAKVDGIPLIVAHEICKKWGNGCKTREDGYCFLYEPQESEDKE